MLQILIDNPLILLFLVSTISYLIGRIKIKGSSLGVAAALFVGLAFGALSPDLRIPDVIFQLGLITFVYTIGLSSGPGFFASFRRQGLRDNLFIWGMLTISASLTATIHLLLDLRPTLTTGLFAGSLTNTPALAGILETINNTALPEQLEQLLAEPVVGYSVAYPMGVLAMILITFGLQRLWRIDYPQEANRVRKYYLVEQQLYNRTVRVTNPAAADMLLQELIRQRNWHIVFSRLKRGDQVFLVDGQTRLHLDDLVILIGTPEDVDTITPYLGQAAVEQLELDRSAYDARRIFVSNPQIVGRRLADLKLPQRFGALVTRVRRGDIDMLAEGDTALELGDRVRVVAQREAIPAVSAFFGDSYRALSELNLSSLGLGLTLGMLLGLISIPLPGGIEFKLGFAGGPLIVALILGAVRRTGSIVWTIPYSANLTLRQIGLIFLLSGIGVRSGYTFLETFSRSGGLSIFLAGMVITSATAFLTLWIGFKVLKIPYALLTGMLSGLQTQPAVLGFALEQSRNELPNIGYTLVFPIATITKILYAQLLLTLLP